MKIKAIRAAEVGLFGDGVALEGLSGGLDVLAGPNELGKSTLFRALSLLISEKHTSTAKAIQSLRPNRGGTPMIEADLEVGGRMWRLRKRYLAQRMAELIDLGSNEVWRGADAEGRVEALFRAGGRDDLRGLVWVAQAKSFALPEGDGELGSALAALIEQEAASTSGLGRARRVRDSHPGLRGTDRAVFWTPTRNAKSSRGRGYGKSLGAYRSEGDSRRLDRQQSERWERRKVRTGFQRIPKCRPHRNCAATPEKSLNTAAEDQRRQW